MLQVKRRFPSIQIAVCESRLEGAKRIREERPDVNLLLLDDAYQHRYIARDVNILLTTYKKPYFKDYLLPMGNLREFRYSKTRANIIVVTKCPPGSTRKSLRKYFRKIRASGKQYATFTMNSYEDPRGLFTNEPIDFSAYQTCLLVTGIVSNQDLKEHLALKDKQVEELEFKDHANYDKGRVKKIIHEFQALNKISATCIITTEKDAVKLSEWKDELSSIPIFSIRFSFELDKNHQLQRWILPRILQ